MSMSDLYADRCSSAIRSGDIDLLKRLKVEGYTYTENHFKEACGVRRIPVLEYLKSIECPYTSNCYVVAAECDYVDVLLWLQKNNYPYKAEELETFLVTFEDSDPYYGEYVEVCAWIKQIKCKEIRIQICILYKNYSTDNDTK